MIHPSDRAMVESYLHDLDAQGAARELARLLNLDRDAAELVEWCISEAHEAALWKYREEAEMDAMLGEDES